MAQLTEDEGNIEEKWVPVPGYSNYSVSNYGRVVNEETGVELKFSYGKNGVPRVRLSKKGHKRSFYIRRLVAEAFFLNFDSSVDVKNINGDLLDNSVLNITLIKKQGRGASCGGS